MTRKLFESEKRIMRNIALEHLGHEPSRAEFVYLETYCPTRRQGGGGQFNSDFRLQLDERDLSEIDFSPGCAGGMSPVLPNTIGAEIFLTVEKSSDKPILLELMGGDAFGVDYFGRYIRDVETMLKELTGCARKPTLRGSDSSEFIEASGLLERGIKEVSIKHCAYSRILVVGSDICFLLFPEATSPVMRGVRHTLIGSPHCEVDCYLSGSEITCLDGWVSTQVPTTCVGPGNSE